MKDVKKHIKMTVNNNKKFFLPGTCEKVYNLIKKMKSFVLSRRIVRVFFGGVTCNSQ